MSTVPEVLTEFFLCVPPFCFVLPRFSKPAHVLGWESPNFLWLISLQEGETEHGRIWIEFQPSLEHLHIILYVGLKLMETTATLHKQELVFLGNECLGKSTRWNVHIFILNVSFLTIQEDQYHIFCDDSTLTLGTNLFID